MKKKIVGFAGVNLAKKLSNREGILVTLVDKNNYNFFPPLLYQVATGMLEVSNISAPFRTSKLESTMGIIFHETRPD